ncbi:MAG: Gfo/Idh/MocA family oxidoreductase [Candidatus Bathyarchaeota archaeon]|nr:Gfo/Idh/MocA family oxidoreductase [Candidatus Bathyarchaeota archaeon]
MRTIKVAIIGCGSWGRNHARVYRELPGVELLAVSDLNPQTAKQIGDLYHVSYYTDPTTVIDDPNIDLISICTPTITHAEIAVAAIEAGKHVLVEKPMTNTVAEAQHLISTAKRNNQKLAIGFVERFNPAVQEAIKRVSEGQIGEVILAHTQRVSRSPERIGDVGVIKDLAIHDIDIVDQLFEDEAQSVFAVAGSIQHKYEDYAQINISFGNNKNALVSTNWLTPRKIRTLMITGTEGILNVEYITQQITIENNNQLVQPYLPYKEPLMLELKSLTDAVRDDTQPKVTGEDGLRALRICEAALQSAKSGKLVKLT